MRDDGIADDRIAVVGEDDPDVRDLIELVLSQSGFQVVLAKDGPSAVEAVRAHRPLLTTLDINMPGMDGFAVAKRIRDFSYTYLIMITSMTEEIDVIRGFEAGADDYLVKPFRPRELRARADSMLRRVAYGPPSVGAAGADTPPAPPAVPPESWASAASRELIQDGALPPTAAPEPTGGDAVPTSPVGPRTAPPPAPTSPTQQPTADQDGPPARTRDGDSFIRFQGLTVEPHSGVATLGGHTLDLTQPESDLLISLLRTGRRVRSKADLVLVMRGQQFVTSHFINEADKREVERHILSLMRKLGDEGSPSTQYIEVVRGVGYRMADHAV